MPYKTVLNITVCNVNPLLLSNLRNQQKVIEKKHIWETTFHYVYIFSAFIFASLALPLT